MRKGKEKVTAFKYKPNRAQRRRMDKRPCDLCSYRMPFNEVMALEIVTEKKDMVSTTTHYAHNDCIEMIRNQKESAAK